MHEITKYFLFTENQEQMSESVLSHPCRAGVDLNQRTETECNGANAQVQLGILALKSTNQLELGPNMSIA